MPQHSQWLYSQLYAGNYNELPWFRQSLQPSAGNDVNGMRGDATDAIPLSSNRNAEHHQQQANDKRNAATLPTCLGDKENCASPPVTSTKRTPSPKDDIEIVTQSNNVVKAKSDSLKCRTPKQVDVWRPY